MTSTTARADVALQLTASMQGGWFRTTPAFSVDGLTTSTRQMRPGTLRSKSSLGMLGFGLGSDLILDDRWTIPLFGFGMAWAVGPYDDRLTSWDGSIAKLSPWSTMRFDFLFPGIGRRGKYRRFQWGAAVRSGIAYVRMDASVAAGDRFVPLSLGNAAFSVQAEVEGCRRLDPGSRICLQVAPRLYEQGLLPGFMVSLRAEWGQ
jgi:hypothetical protein